MNYHDYATVATQATTPTATPTSASHNNGYYYPLSSTSPLDTTSTGYIVTHQHTPTVITYSTDTANATDTTTIIDTSSYSFSTAANDQQHSFQQAHNGYSLYQQQQQQQEEDGTLALNHIQMASNWQNQTTSAAPMISTDPHFTTLNNDEELLVPFTERGVAGFVCKLYQSLEAPDGGEKYAHWCHHNGKDMFIIDCIPKFTETVLPKLFKHCKFASFVRQLNIYGFQRDTDARKSKDSKDKEICRWYHTHFRPGRRDLFHLIRRKAPRYSRRKRIKLEQDEEKTSLHSGDDSDQDNGNVTLQQSSSPNTSAATTPTMKNMNAVMMYSSPTSMFQNDDGSTDSSPMMVSPPPPLPPPSSSSATVAASDSPSPQQNQSADHASSSVLSIHQQQPQQQELGNPSSALLLTHQLHPFQHPNQSDMQSQQQDSNSNIQQQDMGHTYQHPQHETPTSLCLTSPLGLDNALTNAGSAHFIEDSQPPQQPHPSFQSHQLQQAAILHPSQLTSSSSSSSSSDPLQPQQHHHHHHHPHFQQLQRPQHHPLLSMDQDPNMYPMMFQAAPVSMTSPTSTSSTFYKEELKAHITRLQHEYQQMHTYFTNELGKAREQIKTQRLRSEFLERSLRGEQ